MSSIARTYEKLGAFYLGRSYDLASSEIQDDLVLYDSKDLTTHALCVGMTGSGKTGLCIGLLEEAAIDGIPALIIDPKGDLTNLLLTFPELRPDDFAPWINEDDARRNGMSAEEFAKAQADLWRKGLASWNQDGDRIRRLREAAEFAIYTPGSEAGLPISILSSFAAPPAALMEDVDLYRDRISTTATSLLALLGIDADPIRSREHILLSTLLDRGWQQGQSLDLGRLIQLIQSPPISRIGVLELESFYPAKERFELAMALNSLLASPGFASWIVGDPLDVDRLLYTPDGKPKVSICYIAHLSDAERMFFVSLLLNQTVSWMRGRTGTTSLRALVYMDEIFGFMPPVANPPSKKPLLTLLKQARAFGVGVVLATQNPVDLDYKGLSNCGTWFLGRLQTERDKNRVLVGLEGVSVGTGGPFDRQEMEKILAGLGKRVFLMHNVHEETPAVFHTRWAMSYLRGPMTRRQIKRLRAASGGSGPGSSEGAQQLSTAAAATASVTVSASPPGKSAAPSQPPMVTELSSSPPPILPPEISQCFLPVERSSQDGEYLYRPRLLGTARVHFVDSRRGFAAEERVALLSPLTEGSKTIAWEDAAVLELTEADVVAPPSGAARYAELHAAFSKPRNYAVWKKSLADCLYHNRRYQLLKSAHLGEISHAGESEREFRIRIVERTHEERDLQIAKLRKKYDSKFKTLRERIRKAESAVQREQEQASAAKMQTVISVGATLLSAVLGRQVSSTTIGKATTAARGAGYAARQSQDVQRARQNVEAYSQELAALEKAFQAEIEAIRSKLDPLTQELETMTLKPRRSEKPRRSDIDIRMVSLAWAPYMLDVDGARVPAWR